MTIKELIEFTGKSPRTIRTWIKKADMQGCAETAQGIVIDYSIDDIEKILKAGTMSKDAVSILMQNARSQQLQVIDNSPMTAMLNFMAKMQEQQQRFMTAVLSRLDKQEPKQLSLPENPGINPRDYLNQLVREYAQLKSVNFQKAWNILYTEILYRCKTNIKVKARNEGIKPIDYLEREGMILTSCSIVKGLING